MHWRIHSSYIPTESRATFRQTKNKSAFSIINFLYFASSPSSSCIFATIFPFLGLQSVHISLSIFSCRIRSDWLFPIGSAIFIVISRIRRLRHKSEWQGKNQCAIIMCIHAPYLPTHWDGATHRKITTLCFVCFTFMRSSVCERVYVSRVSASPSLADFNSIFEPSMCCCFAEDTRRVE